MKLLLDPVSRVRLIGLAEGLSFLILLFIAMPLKYMYNMPATTKAVGAIHGILFVVYIFVVFAAHSELKWKFKKTAILLLASVIPFGTIYTDKKILKPQN